MRQATRATLAVLLLVPGLAVRPASAQFFGLERAGPDDSVLVGEVVTFHARVHLDPVLLLTTPVPVLVGDLPDGVRFLGADTLRLNRERTVLSGDVRFAFYRPGRQQVPPLEVTLKPIVANIGHRVESEPAAVTVGSTLPPGNPTLRDIRDDLPAAPVNPLVWIGAVVAALAAVLGARFLHRRRKTATQVSLPDSASVPATALARAQAALDQLAAASWSDADQYYAQVTDVLRQYLIEVAPAVSPALTSRELLAVLHHPSANGAWSGMQRVLTAADVVKFAGQRPSAVTARAWTDDVRHLLAAWDGILAPAPTATPRATASVSRGSA